MSCVTPAATYKISTAPAPDIVKCATLVNGAPCGHIAAAHGSNGLVCCRCRCPRFTPAVVFDLEKREVTGVVV